MGKKMNAADMTYYIAKAGDIIKGSGKGDMATGAKVIIGGAIVAGGVATVAAQKIGKMLSKKKKK